MQSPLLASLTECLRHPASGLNHKFRRILHLNSLFSRLDTRLLQQQKSALKPNITGYPYGMGTSI
ncbi:DNA-directed RNA polymerase [Pseudomonas syringae pv. actinidiae]|uniref:DNA-directed RNA polymerase n=1 Tax=Pseudomonas syringae pv. actinidiae TaxID=103796 RepID=A0A2V0QGN8_PSESF|nr:DNA-directed RNA polymerase [Pseudomonas syringae pv. actinidiae]GBH16398.1 DNA-directed RNA polymerase [Pseudomonas syringae pv. actinidiae]